MIVVLRHGATEEAIQEVCERLERAGYQAVVWRGVERTVIGAIGVVDEEVKTQLIQQLESLPFVESAIRILRPYKLVSREWKGEPTLVPVRDKVVGGEHLIIMAGPCSVESREQILESARGVKERGAGCPAGWGVQAPHLAPHLPRVGL
jgi:3-deoxy-7-phosphoheptulonate synthase